MTLAMTLLVRDEMDIIQANLDFHLTQGVDHVVVIDNGSVDGTRGFVQEYARNHPVTLIDQPEQTYNQTRWMTDAALHARDHLGATWVLNNDADEFWLSPSGNLKDHLGEGVPDSLICQRHNMVFAWNGDDHTHWAETALFHVAKPLNVKLTDVPLMAPLPCPYFYRRLPPKVLTRTRGLTKIAQGNHSAEYAHAAITGPSDIQIYHYPVRSRVQLRSKVENGGRSYAANTEFSQNVGWHWRRWYQMLNTQGIDAVMADALPSTTALQQDLGNGTLIRDAIIAPLLTGASAPSGTDT